MKAAVWVLLLVGFNYRVRERCCCRRHLGFYFLIFFHFIIFGAVRTTKSFVIHRCCSDVSAQISETVIFSSKLARVKLEACEKQLFRWPTRVQFSNFFGLASSFFFFLLLIPQATPLCPPVLPSVGLWSHSQSVTLSWEAVADSNLTS